MKIVAALMVLIGLVLVAGAVPGLQHFDPDARQFWVGIFATPASALFVVAGVLLWLRGQRVRSLVVVAAVVMAAATIAATMLGVMGPPATLIGTIGVLVVAIWFWRTRQAVAV